MLSLVSTLISVWLYFAMSVKCAVNYVRNQRRIILSMLSFLRLCRFSWTETAKQLTSVYTRVVYVWKWCNLQRRKYVQNKHVNKSTNWFSFMSTLRPSTELSLFVICVWCFLTADLFSSERCIAINMGIFGSFALLFFFKKKNTLIFPLLPFIHPFTLVSSLTLSRWTNNNQCKS